MLAKKNMSLMEVFHVNSAVNQMDTLSYLIQKLKGG